MLTSDYVAPPNVEKIASALVSAMVTRDLAFAEQLGTPVPHRPSARTMFDSKRSLIKATNESEN